MVNMKMRPMRKICICGGGSVAHVLSAVLGNNKECIVNVLTRNPHLWENEIEIDYKGVGLLKGKLNKVSAKPVEVLSDADLVFIVVPTFAYKELWHSIKDVIPNEAVLGAFAGNGGFDWIVKEHQGTVFGMQRIPYVCRTVVYGKSVFVKGVRKTISIGTRPANKAASLATVLSGLLQIEISALPNYLNVGLAPSNPILHSVRMYSLYSMLQTQKIPNGGIMFYEHWDDLASKLFFSCDEEIQRVCRVLSIDTTAVLSISQHYGVDTITELSIVIRQIESLKGLTAPVLDSKYPLRIDLSHRFIIEDVLVNLPVYQHYGRLANVRMDTIDKLVKWGVDMTAKSGICPDYNAVDCAVEAGVTDLQSLIDFYR